MEDNSQEYIGAQTLKKRRKTVGLVGAPSFHTRADWGAVFEVSLVPTLHIASPVIVFTALT